jgi:hypothetical protein
MFFWENVLTTDVNFNNLRADRDVSVATLGARDPVG